MKSQFLSLVQQRAVIMVSAELMKAGGGNVSVVRSRPRDPVLILGNPAHSGRKVSCGDSDIRVKRARAIVFGRRRVDLRGI